MSETQPSVPKPLPVLEGLTGEFYTWCRQEELRFQRCTACDTWRHVPREICADCGSWEWEWAQSSGRGSVFTWTVVARALHPAFREDVPIAPAVIELEEGVRLLSEVVGKPMSCEVVRDAGMCSVLEGTPAQDACSCSC